MPPVIPSVAQLERAMKIAQRIHKLEAELTAIIGQPHLLLEKTSSDNQPTFAAKPELGKSEEPGTGEKPRKRKGGISATGRAAIVAAQKARWAKVKANS